MKAMFWTLLIAAGIASCGSRSANSAPVVELVPVEESQAPETVVFDKTVHDFGDVSVTDGPLSCTFTVTNKGSEPISVYEVVSSCGCTDVKWTKGALNPGESGTVSATYKNQDGPLPFDKTLTVYISGLKRPVVLRLRGVVHEKKKSLSELYGAQKLGDFGLKARQFKTGTLKQGLTVSETAPVANLGKKPLQVSWADVSPQLTVSVEPNPIPAGSTATLQFTIRADSALYGKTVYSATPVLNGKKASAMFCRAVTKLSFSVEILPANVWLCASRFPKNSPPSLVALLNAAVTMSAVIAPCAIASFNLATEMPVCFDISVNGLKPWFMSWSKSWPMSFPVDWIWPNTRARPFNLF